MSEPTPVICSISARREERSRLQEAAMAASLPAIRAVLMAANRSGRGAAAAPEREANTEEISPSFRERLRSRDADPGAVAMPRI